MQFTKILTGVHRRKLMQWTMWRWQAIKISTQEKDVKKKITNDYAQLPQTTFYFSYFRLNTCSDESCCSIVESFHWNSTFILKVLNCFERWSIWWKANEKFHVTLDLKRDYRKHLQIMQLTPKTNRFSCFTFLCYINVSLAQDVSGLSSNDGSYLTCSCGSVLLMRRIIFCLHSFSLNELEIDAKRLRLWR